MSAERGRLGLLAATALVVGSQIGSGVFLLPASLAPYGWGAVVGTLLSAVGALLLAFMFARLSVTLPLPGGPHAYVRAAFGDAAAFVTGWTYWLVIWFGNAGLAVAATAYASHFFPVLKADAALSAAVGIGTIWLFTLVNLAGTRTAGAVQTATTLLKLVPLAAVIGVGAFVLLRDGSAVLATPAPVPASPFAIGGAVVLTMWAFLGMECATVPAGRIANPRRTIPLATVGGTAISALVTLGVVAAVVLTLPAVPLASDPAPLASFVAHWASGEWGTVIALAALVSALGCMNGWIMLQAEVPAALAGEGLFPRAMAARRGDGTPGIALVISAVLVSGVLLMTADSGAVAIFSFIAQVAVLAALLVYAGVAVAALVLARRGRVERSAPFVAACVLSGLFCVAAFAVAGGRETLWVLVLMAAGLPVWLWTRRGVVVRQG
ncbi:amino acid permease [Sandaracinobacteroides saxicola]|uniref:Arginine/agmatine antiporter n=1 Tax=Sandaracinobacteroides saxicola TaxID=2759707 RepID=A0A7G5IH46_9SPHN|nr:amino acid permease [Sandaracinobacteroides saxicola]QMW22688.1 amino acid permease [Sandaracinobacteroides saxicola]